MSDRAIELVLSAFDAFSRGDAEALSKTMAADVELFTPTAEIANAGRPYRGVEGLRRYLGDVDRVWQELRVVPHRFAATDETVVAIGRVYGRDRDGAVIDSPAGWLWTLRDELIASVRVFDSHEAVLELAGLEESRLEPLGQRAAV